MELTNFLKNFGKAIIPASYRVSMRNYVRKAGYSDIPYSAISILFFVSFLVTGFIFFYFDLFSLISDMNPLFIGLLVMLYWLVGTTAVVSIIYGGLYFYFNMRIYNRVKEIEENLPEFLVLVSTNLKGGLSFEKSLWSSIKPEFGLLAEEMGIVSKRVMTGEELTEALRGLAHKYDSPRLKRTINVIVGQIESGGEVAEVLDRQIENLRKSNQIKQEMSANTLSYTIFIGAIVIVVSPLLFALAFNLLTVLINVADMIGTAGVSGGSGGGAAPGGLGGGGGGGLSFDEIDVSPNNFRNFSVAAISIIAFFSSMILSIIQRGDIKGGIKYMPFFIAASMVTYFVFMSFLSGFLQFA